MTGAKRVACLVCTRQCNLRCTYCYVEDKREAHMPLAVAQQAVREAFTVDGEGIDFVEIDFIGGEPLCVFPMLRGLHEWALAQGFDKPFVFYATTNGTLLDAEMKRYFRENKETFWLGLSYDGSPEAQDSNRSGSSGAVDVDFFRETWPGQAFKMTIDERNVATLARDVIAMHERGIAFSASVACGMPAWRPASLALYARELSRLVAFYLDHPASPMVNLLTEIDLPSLARRAPDPARRMCEAGTRLYYAVDMDGTRYPCHMLSPLALRAEQMAGQDMFSLLEAGRVEGPCATCVLSAACPLCYGMSYRCLGDAFARESNICRTFRLQTMAACKLHTARIRRAERITPADRRMSRAILAVRQALKESEPINNKGGM